MANYRDVKGLSVITLAEGKKVGQVEDLVVDPDARAVRWLRISSGAGGLFGGGTALWAPAGAVHSVGEHAVTINSEANLEESEEVPQAAEMARSGRAILGKKMLSESGRYLGEARDFTFSPEDFRLISISVGQGNALSPQVTEIDAASLRTIGEDVIVVSDGPEGASQFSEMPGGVTTAGEEESPVEKGWTDLTDRDRPRDAGAPRTSETGRTAAGSEGSRTVGGAQVYDSTDMR